MRVTSSFRTRITARAALAFLVLLPACRDLPAPADPTAPPVESDPRLENPDWTPATHERRDPAYDVVFPGDSVNRIDIVLGAEAWAAIRRNMTDLWGFDFGAPAAGTLSLPDVKPAYVDATVTFGGRRWNHVGFRLKGHQSLLFSWKNGVYKLPFRLHFDRLEDSIPAVEDQRFYGFREISMAPGFSDPSLMRDRVASELFRRAGIPAAATAFYRVYIDFGEGPRYCGVYTAIEVIDDTMVERWFGEEAGSIYKPESDFSRFRAEEFEKKNRKSEADWSDARTAVETLNSPLRLTDPPAWRAGLETVFDADHFLRWLAVSVAMVNTDSYGDQARNYYLYRHPQRGLVWIPWDHNLALRGDPGMTGAGTRPDEGLSLALDEVDEEWPLIRYLLDDPVYAARYLDALRNALEALDPAATDAMISRFQAQIERWVEGPDGEVPGYSQLPSPGAFGTGVAELRAHLRRRSDLLARYLAGGS